MDIVFPREEAYLDALGGKKDDDDGAAEPAEDAVVVNKPELVMKQLKFVNVLVTTPSVKKRVWIWRKIVPGIVLQHAEWSKEGAVDLRQRFPPPAIAPDLVSKFVISTICSSLVIGSANAKDAAPDSCPC